MELPVFLKLALGALNKGLAVILMERDWFSLELSPGFTFSDWSRQCGSETRDERHALLGIATGPLFRLEDRGTELELMEVRLSGCADSWAALRAAVWYAIPLLSFKTRFPWNTNPIQALKVTLVADEWLEEPVQVANICDEPALNAVFSEPKREIRRGARDLGCRWSELFPDLELCGDARSQLLPWRHGLDMLAHVEEALTKLQDLAKRWKLGEISDYQHEHLRRLGLRVTGESESCWKNPRTRDVRTFWTARGEQQYFEAHIKLAMEFRIHFYPDAIWREIHVGYIGPHLPLC